MRILYFICLLFLCTTASASAVDTTIGITAPASATVNYKTLTHHLCDPLAGDEAKANAIYNWITHNIRYDINMMKSYPKKPIPVEKLAERTLKDRKGVCEGYAVLLTEMCREAGLQAVNIDGYAKDWMFDNGDKIYIPRHAWCAVLINGSWELMDPTWGAGGMVQAPGWLRQLLNKITHTKVMYARKMKFEFIYDPQYFMQDPMVFRLRHLPTDPLWQLTDTLMPREYFESGDSAVLSFNKLCKRVKNTPELQHIVTLDEKQKAFEYAERAYLYNDRFPAILARKEILKAVSELEKAYTDTTITTGLLLVKDAERSLKKSEDLIKEQKKSFPGQYADLKKKNKEKSQAAKQDIRKIKADDKKVMAQCKKYTNTVQSKYTRVQKKKTVVSTAARGVDARKISHVAPAKVQKKSSSPELKVLTDSIESRKERIALIKREIETQSGVLKENLLASSKLLDSFGKNLVLTDSLIIQQTLSRLKMKDNYDDEVILLTRLLNEMKYNRSDTLLKYYLAGFDTVTAMYDRQLNTRKVVLDIYRQNMRSMEQYKKWNSYDTCITTQYIACVNEYREEMQMYNAEMTELVAYLKGNKKLFSGLTRVSKRQIKITEYMDKAENMRQVLEQKNIAGKKAFDMQENDKHRLQVQDLRKRLEKITAAAGR